MIRTGNRLRLCGALIVILLIFIWGNSMLPASASQAFSDWVKEILSALLPGRGTRTGGGSGLLRKIAHFTEFAALGAALGWLFGMLKRRKTVPFLWGAAAACVDETIQMLAPGRAPRITDVLLDSFGILAGLMLLYLGHHYIIKRST